VTVTELGFSSYIEGYFKVYVVPKGIYKVAIIVPSALDPSKGSIPRNLLKFPNSREFSC
jgi:hypothetical protein